VYTSTLIKTKAHYGIEFFFSLRKVIILKNQKKYSNSLNNALDRYAILSFEGPSGSNEIKGVRSILMLLSDLNIDSFVVSGG
jgi:hypothetical protein